MADSRYGYRDIAVVAMVVEEVDRAVTVVQQLTISSRKFQLLDLLLAISYKRLSLLTMVAARALVQWHWR